MVADLREGWDVSALRWAMIVVVSMAGINFILAGVWLVLGPSIANATIGATAWGLVLSARAVALLVMGIVMYRLTLIHPLLGPDRRRTAHARTRNRCRRPVADRWRVSWPAREQP
ncbi:MAG: hypothetical protein ABR615_09870 [Pseudonocardiaceae bacterium]